MEQAKAILTMVASDGLPEMICMLQDGPPAKTSYNGPMARVKISIGIVIELTKYTNVKPTVELDIPVHPSKVNEGFDIAYAWCDEKLAAIRTEVEKAIGKGA